jgi:hypothetical protein
MDAVQGHGARVFRRVGGLFVRQGAPRKSKPAGMDLVKLLFVAFDKRIQLISTSEQQIRMNRGRAGRRGVVGGRAAMCGRGRLVHAPF